MAFAGLKCSSQATFKKHARKNKAMRGYILFLLLGLAAVGCVGEQPEMNQTNVTENVTEEPERNCTGPVCGADGNTYQTDCDAVDAGIAVMHAGPCPEENCTDSDGGVEPAVRGTVSKGDENQTDYCLDSEQLVEYVCLDNYITMTTVLCGEDEECGGGECAARPEPNITTGCTGPVEPDIFTKQNVTANGTLYTDACVDYKTVKDYYCRNNKLESLNNECPAGSGCSEGRCVDFAMECTETDAGNDTLIRGKTTATKGFLVLFSKWDECIDEGMLREHYCLENGTAATEDVLCGSGLKCVSDRCVRSKCDDTDGGFDIYEAGTVTFEDEEYDDKCRGREEVIEYYCYGDDVRSDDKLCGEDYICNRGKCVEGSIS
jgi:hypothetical protein